VELLQTFRSFFFQKRRFFFIFLEKKRINKSKKMNEPEGRTAFSAVRVWSKAERGGKFAREIK
jgi:hypothetical protein